jgi:hypothetical protein
MHGLHTPSPGARQLPYSRTDYRRDSKRSRRSQPLPAAYERVLKPEAAKFELAERCRGEFKAWQSALDRTYWNQVDHLATRVRIRNLQLPHLNDVRALEVELSEFAWPLYEIVNPKSANRLLAGVIKDPEVRRRVSEVFDPHFGANIFGAKVEQTSPVVLATAVKRLRLSSNEAPTGQQVAETCRKVVVELGTLQKAVLWWLDLFAKCELAAFEGAREAWAAPYGDLDTIFTVRGIKINNDAYRAALALIETRFTKKEKKS